MIHIDFGGDEIALSKKRLAVNLRRSTRWVELRTREGMPSTMDGNRRMFRMTVVRAWLADNGPGSGPGPTGQSPRKAKDADCGKGKSGEAEKPPAPAPITA